MNRLGFTSDRLAARGLYGRYGGLHLSIFDTWTRSGSERDRKSDQPCDTQRSAVLARVRSGLLRILVSLQHYPPALKRSAPLLT